MKNHFAYKDSTVKATIYYRHSSGEQCRFGRTRECEVDECEYARLQGAFLAFERGEGKRRTFPLRLNNQQTITLRLDKIWGILHQPRELVAE
jgi:hypothetical protein